MRIFKNFNLKYYNAYRINSTCSVAIFPENESDLIKIFKQYHKPIIIGNGNNIILTKSHYDEVFVIFNSWFFNISISDLIVQADAGATLEQISYKALESSLRGFEIFCDIPSSVGGAVVMNAGTKEGEIKDYLLKVRYLDLDDMVIKEILSEDIGFEYRNSFFQKNTNKIISKAWFKLQKGKRSEIKAKMDLNREIRWAKQPRDYPNCGSVFKRPPGRFVGPMLDELGMKGFSIGGAQISVKHSGFIVNTGNATGNDVLAVISEAQKRVREKFGVDLEVEQRYI